MIEEIENRIINWTADALRVDSWAVSQLWQLDWKKLDEWGVHSAIDAEFISQWVSNVG